MNMTNKIIKDLDELKNKAPLDDVKNLNSGVLSGLKLKTAITDIASSSATEYVNDQVTSSAVSGSIINNIESYIALSSENTSAPAIDEIVNTQAMVSTYSSGSNLIITLHNLNTILKLVTGTNAIGEDKTYYI